MSTPPMPTRDLEVRITDEDVRRFRADGFISVPRITTDEEVAWLGEIYDTLFAERRGGFPGGFFDLARPYDTPGEDDLPQALFPERAVPELRDTVYVRNARSVIARLLGVGEAELDGWGHMILKPARHGHETPWHQDEAYWEPHLTYEAVGAWMPLDDVDEENGCMMFVPGSHRSDVLAHRHISNDPAVHGLELDVAVDTSTAVAVPLRAGGATFHHPRTLHATGANRSERRRRAYANEFQTEPRPAATRADRPWVDAHREAWSSRDPSVWVDRTAEERRRDEPARDTVR